MEKDAAEITVLGKHGDAAGMIGRGAVFLLHGPGVVHIDAVLLGRVDIHVVGRTAVIRGIRLGDLTCVRRAEKQVPPRGGRSPRHGTGAFDRIVDPGICEGSHGQGRNDRDHKQKRDYTRQTLFHGRSLP